MGQWIRGYSPVEEPLVTRDTALWIYPQSLQNISPFSHCPRGSKKLGHPGVVLAPKLCASVMWFLLGASCRTCCPWRQARFGRSCVSFNKDNWWHFGLETDALNKVTFGSSGKHCVALTGVVEGSCDHFFDARLALKLVFGCLLSLVLVSK